MAITIRLGLLAGLFCVPRSRAQTKSLEQLLRLGELQPKLAMPGPLTADTVTRVFGLRPYGLNFIR